MKTLLTRGLTSSGQRSLLTSGLQSAAVAVGLIAIKCLDLSLLPSPQISFTFLEPDSILFTFLDPDSLNFEWLPLVGAIAFSEPELIDLQLIATSTVTVQPIPEEESIIIEEDDVQITLVPPIPVDFTFLPVDGAIAFSVPDLIDIEFVVDSVQFVFLPKSGGILVDDVGSCIAP